jgi:lipopolysaccharide export system protein LptC
VKPVSGELHLPDLPEVPVAIGPEPAPARPVRLPLTERLRQALLNYLPLALMVLLAVLSWWLVRTAPRPDTTPAPSPARHLADYQLQRFQLQRYDAEGRPTVRLEGEQLRHYPDADQHEIDAVRLWLTGTDGRQTEATARQAVVDGDGNRVRLQGDVQVRSQSGTEPPLMFEGQQLLVLVPERQLRTDQPVRVRHGHSEFTAAALVFDEPRRTLELTGRLHATLTPDKALRR